MAEMMFSEQTCACGGTCECGGQGHHQEVLSKEEYVARLEQYLVDLQMEIKAVQGELADLRQTA